jgi:DNA-binding beta-propeller fold protein YncE
VPLVSLLLMVALSAPPLQGRGREQDDDERPRVYPYLLDAVDALFGHLIDGRYRSPTGVFYEPVAGELYVADSKNGLIGIYDDSGTPLFAFGRDPLLGEPKDVAAAADGTIFVLDAADSRVHAFSYRGEPRGELIFEYPALEDEPAGIVSVNAMALDAQGRWFVADSALPQVVAYEPDLTFRFAIRTQRAGAQFQMISDVAVSPDGLIAVTDLAATPVQVFDAAGRFLAGFGKRDIGVENFTSTNACGFDAEGYLFVVDMLRHNVKIFEPSGAFRGFFGGWFSPETRGMTPGEMRYPTGIAFAPDGRIFVAERFGHRVQVFRPRPRGEEAPVRIPSASRGGG